MKSNKRKISFFIWILAGLVLGVLYGLFSAKLSLTSFTSDFIKPWGIIFINLLKLVAIPLILFSLIKGVSDLKNISRLSRLGMKTIALYLITTMLAVSLGLVLVNIIRPGEYFAHGAENTLAESYSASLAAKQQAAETLKEQGPLQVLVDIVPDNIVAAASNNSMMLQVIFVALLFGVAMILLPVQKVKPFKDVIDSGNDIVLKVIDIIMYMAPLGVFALMASVIADITQANAGSTGGLFSSLLMYALAVVVGLFLLLLLYPVVLRIIARLPVLRFFKSVFPAQLLAFSTSSSAATLPVTMKCAEENLGVSDEVSSFVLPLGATVNMDGTALYQAVAAVFIAQVYGIDLGLTEQLSIVFTATIASIGAAAVPGAGIIILSIILNSLHIPVEGIAMIIAVDRPLDMLRTTVNVTGDCFVASIISRKTLLNKKPA